MEERYISSLLVRDIGWKHRFCQYERKPDETAWKYEDGGEIIKKIIDGNWVFVQGDTEYNIDHVIAIKYATEKPSCD